MEIKLSEAHKVEFEEIDFNEKLTMNGVVHYMQQVAANHAIELGFSYYKSGEETAYYWIISRAKFIIDKYPKWQEKVTIETYPGGYEKLFAVRLFNLINEQGEKIGHIIGDYILMDAITNRPVKIKGGKGPLSVLDFPYEGESLDKLMVPLEAEKQDLRKVRYSEIDVNYHMNNAHHVKWAVDILPIDLLKTKEISTFQINYNKGISYGTEVVVKLSEKAENEFVVWGTDKDDTVNYFTANMILRDI